MSKFKAIQVTAWAVAALAIMAWAKPTIAAFPEKPITVIVPWAPGGGTDILARAVCPIWEKTLGQPMIIVNKPGGNNIVGYKAFLDAPHDGYTIVLGQSPNLNINVLFQKAPFKIEDMHFINLFQKDDLLFYVNKNAPWKNMADLVADAKKRPGQIKLGAVTVKGMDAYFVKEFEERAGIKFGGLVPMGSGGTLRREVVGGHITIAVHGPWVARGGKELVRGLGVRAMERSPIWPEAETFNDVLPKEKKFTAEEVETIPTFIKGFAVPANLKSKFPDRFEKLVKTFEAAMKLPEWKKMMAEQEMDSAFQYFGPDDTKRVIDAFTKLMLANRDLFETPPKK